MRLIVTGGGTGGHVLPALEVALLAREAGHDVQYFGSVRGQESRACARAAMPFRGIESRPLRRLYTFQGLSSAIVLLRAVGAARTLLNEIRPDVLFSTGGYSASPFLTASRMLGITVVIHEQNSVPGRTHKIAAKHAAKKCIVFEEAALRLGEGCVRTGMPIRKEIVKAAQQPKPDSKEGFLTFALGGSQGAAALNEVVMSAALRINGQSNRWLHVSGEKQYESMAKSADRLGAFPGYRIRPYLQAGEMADALASADLAVARSGAGVLAELALFGIPSILIPYPFAYANHQYHNAKLFENMGAAEIIEQRLLTPEKLETAWREWHANEDRRAAASQKLKEWAIADAAERVLQQIEEAHRAHQG